MPARHRRILLAASDDEVDDLSFLSRPSPPPTVAVPQPPPEPSPVRFSVLSTTTTTTASGGAGSEADNGEPGHRSSADSQALLFASASGAAFPAEGNRCEDSASPFPIVSIHCDEIEVALVNRLGTPTLLPPIDAMDLVRLDQLRLALDRVSREIRKALAHAAKTQRSTESCPGNDNPEQTVDDDDDEDTLHDESDDEETHSSSDSSDARWRRRVKRKPSAKSGKKERARKPKAAENGGGAREALPTVSELKQKLKLRGLSVTGRKSQLLSRLATAPSPTSTSGVCLENPIVLIDDEDGDERHHSEARTFCRQETTADECCEQLGEHSATAVADGDSTAVRVAGAHLTEGPALDRLDADQTPDPHVADEGESTAVEKDSAGRRSGFAAALLERIGFVTPKRLFGWFDPQH